MKLELKQPDVEGAILKHLNDMGIKFQDKNVEMKFTAGRRGNGLTCDVVITDHPQLSSDQSTNVTSIADTAEQQGQEESSSTTESAGDGGDEAGESNGPLFGDN